MVLTSILEAPTFTLLEYAKSIWVAIGPLVGVVIGALLARSWDRQKWIKDNRKQECKELLTAMSKAATLLLAARMAREKEAASRDMFLESLVVFSQSLFITKDAEYQQAFDLWKEAVHNYNTTSDHHKFDDTLEQIRTKVITMATKD